jgi:phenylalanyl-tRNA synthetase beta chain
MSSLISLRLLRSRVPELPDDAVAIAAQLGHAGFSVSGTQPLTELLRPIVVGRVEAVTQHPNADRLKVCVVDDGTDTRLQIVTGADNVAAGSSYPVIRSGTTLPGGRKIKKGKLRGELSEGMLGSADELELGSDHAGLLTLPADVVPGTPLPDAIPVAGVMFVLEGDADPEEVIGALGGKPIEREGGATAE